MRKKIIVRISTIFLLTVAMFFVMTIPTHAASTYACVAADFVWACSPDGTLQGCQNLSACQTGAVKPCIQTVTDICGKRSVYCKTDVDCKNSQLICSNGQCRSAAQPPSGGGSSGGQNVGYDFNIQNPTTYEDFLQLVDAIAGYAFKIIIPIAVLMILYGGALFVTARGNEKQITQAKQVLKYAVIGLVIIFIGQGFVTLINSILDIGNTNSSQSPTSGSNQNQLPTSGGKGKFGDTCFTFSDCESNYCYIPPSGTPGKCANP